MSSRQQQKAHARAEREAGEREAALAAQRRRRLWQLGAAVSFAAAVVAAILVVTGSGSDEPATGGGSAVAGVADSRRMLEGIPQDGASLGDPKAPVVLTEFADLQCPFCRAYDADALPDIIERYVRPGQLRLELRLLRFIGDDSDRAARAAQAAATRDRMWNFVDLFYRNQGQENSGYADDAFLSRLARAAGVSPRLVLDGLKAPALDAPLRTAEAEAQAAGVNSTPSFLIGPKPGRGKRLEPNGLDFASLSAVIEPELGR